MSNLSSLLKQAETAKKNAETELLRIYPVDSHIRFFIMNNQLKASTGTVLGACWYGDYLYLRVRHHQAKPGSRYAVRFVNHKSIV